MIRSLATSLSLLILVLCTSSAQAQVDCAALRKELNQTTAQSLPYAKSWSVLEIIMASSDDLSTAPDLWKLQAPDPPAPLADDSARRNWLDASWAKALGWALSEFDQYAVNCRTEHELEGKDVGSTNLFKRTTPYEALIRFAKSQKVSSSLLSQVIDLPGGAPAPQRLQIALSQIVSNGQPGIAPTVSGSLAPRSRHPLARHLTMAGSAVVIQPVTSSTATGGTPTTAAQLKPVFASGDVGLSVSTQETPYDWYSKIAQQGAQTLAELKDETAAASNELIRVYRVELDRAPVALPKPTPPLPTPPPSTAGEKIRARFAIAAAAARGQFAQSTETYYFDNFIVDTLYTKPVYSGTIKVRITPDATWVPNLPDLISVAAAHQGTIPFAGKTPVDPFGTFDYAISASFSEYPTDTFHTFSGMGDHKPTFLADTSLALSLMLPNANKSGTTRVQLAGLARFRAATNAFGKYEAGFGGSVAVEVPVSERVSLLGSFTERCTAADNPVGTDNVNCVSMLAFTFAAAAIQNPTK